MLVPDGKGGTSILFRLFGGWIFSTRSIELNLTPAWIMRWVAHHGFLAGQMVYGLPRPRRGYWSRANRLKSKRLPLFLYSQVAWDDVWQRPQEMALGLAKYRPVVYCSPVQVHQTAGPLRSRWKPVRTLIKGNLLILSPQILSGEYRNAGIRALNRAILARAIRPFVEGKPHIFLTNSPFSDDLIESLRPVRVGFDLIDDFCAFEWSPPDSRQRQKRILSQTHFSFAGTYALLQQFKGQAKDLDFLASGVDYAKMTARAVEPDELKRLPRPRLLYVGTLNDRLSGDLIDRVARSFPSASVVIVGPRRATFSAPAFPSNVVELGLQPHDRLPGFYQHCDLGIMPFADNAAARAINPVKTLEYLACGLPVISTPVPDVVRFYSPPVVVAEPEHWPEQIRMLLSHGRSHQAAERQQFARGRTWDTLVKKVEAQLRTLEAIREQG